MRQRSFLALAVLVGVLAVAGGMLLARRSGGYAPERTASGRVTIEPPTADAAGATAAPLPAGAFPAAYCSSYGNVARQTGYVYQADLGGGTTLYLADSLDRNPGPQDPARVTLAVTRDGRRWVWRPGTGGTATLSADLLRAEVDARLAPAPPTGAASPAGAPAAAATDTLALRAAFACTPRVDPRKRRR